MTDERKQEVKDEELVMKQKDILEKLARHEITREQAEEMFAELGSPLPQTPPAPAAPAPAKSLGAGCIIAVLIALLLALALPVILLILYTTMKISYPSDHYEDVGTMVVEEMEAVQGTVAEDSGPDPDQDADDGRPAAPIGDDEDN